MGKRGEGTGEGAVFGSGWVLKRCRVFNKGVGEGGSSPGFPLVLGGYSTGFALHFFYFALYVL